MFITFGSKVLGTMIPPRTFKAIRFATNIAWKCGAIPFRFVHDRPAGLYHVTPSFTRSRKSFIQTSFAVNVLYICFLAFRLFEPFLTSEEEVPVTFLIQMGYFLLSYTMTVVLHINTLLFYKESPQFAHRYLNYFNKLKCKYSMRI